MSLKSDTRFHKKNIVYPNGVSLGFIRTQAFCLIPIMYEFGHSIESVRPVLLHARNNMNSEANMKEVMSAIEKLTMELNHT